MNLQDLKIKDPEECEKNIPNLRKFFKDIDDITISNNYSIKDMIDIIRS